MVRQKLVGCAAWKRWSEFPADLDAALVNGELAAIFGIDNTAIVQEYHPPKGGSIVRVEALDGQFLYAIRIYNDPNEGFNLCPADICQVPEQGQPAADATAAVFAKTPKRIEVAEPP